MIPFCSSIVVFLSSLWPDADPPDYLAVSKIPNAPPTHPEAPNRKHWLATGQGRFRSDKGSVKSLPCSVWASSYTTGRDWRRGIKVGVGWMGTLFICPTGRQREQAAGLTFFFPFIFYLSPKTKTKSLYWYNWCWICSSLEAQWLRGEPPSHFNTLHSKIRFPAHKSSITLKIKKLREWRKIRK